MGSWMIPKRPSTVATSPEDSAAEVIVKSVESKSPCLVWVAVQTAHSLDIATPLRSSAICLIFM